MSPLKLALVILRRNLSYAIFVCFGTAFLLYVVAGFVEYSRHVRLERQALQTIDADVIAPKGSTIEHLRRLLRLDLFPEPALIPSQLYTTLSTEPPPGLKLTPVLFWGSYKGVPVIAADLNLQEILKSSFPEIEHLDKREVLIGQQVAEKFHIKPGDRIELKSEFGSLALNTFRDQFTVKGIANLAGWNGAILSSLDQAPSILGEIKFIPEQIWKNLILSYVFVTGPEHFLQQTKQLIDKRTVAVDLRISDEIPGLLKLSGIDEKLELEVLVFALLSSLVALFAFFAIWLPILNQMAKKLIRSGYSTHQLILCFSFIAIILLIAAASISSLSCYLNPIL